MGAGADGAENGRALTNITKKPIDEPSRIRERHEMAARQLIDVHVQSLPRDAPLELDWKETIIPTCNHVYGDSGPGLEEAWLAEDDIRLGALVPLTLLDDFARHIMKEVRSEIEGLAVPALARSLNPCGDRSGILPPFPCGLARNGNHCIDQDENGDVGPGAHQGRGEAPERLRREYDTPTSADRFEDAVRIGGESRLLVVSGEINGEGIVPRAFQERHDPMPVPCDATGARNENERLHEARIITRHDGMGRVAAFATRPRVMLAARDYLVKSNFPLVETPPRVTRYM
jgi:hypothetical protein